MPSSTKSSAKKVKKRNPWSDDESKSESDLEESEPVIIPRDSLLRRAAGILVSLLQISTMFYCCSFCINEIACFKSGIFLSDYQQLGTLYYKDRTLHFLSNSCCKFCFGTLTENTNILIFFFLELRLCSWVFSVDWQSCIFIYGKKLLMKPVMKTIVSHYKPVTLEYFYVLLGQVFSDTIRLLRNYQKENYRPLRLYCSMKHLAP